TLVKAQGADVATVHGLLRHANVSITMDRYVQAIGTAKREAQSRIVQSIPFPNESGNGNSFPFVPIRSHAVDYYGCNCLNRNEWALNSAVECHLHTVEVVGSNPTAPTISYEHLAALAPDSAPDSKELPDRTSFSSTTPWASSLSALNRGCASIFRFVQRSIALTICGFSPLAISQLVRECLKV